MIGWAADDNYKTPLIEQAVEMAARNYPLAENAVFHSDRGSNYTSQQFARTLNKYNLRQSVGRTGICYDNAMAESFFAALKNERVHRTQYPTREHARRDIVRYIEFWYNSRRRHSGLQYRTRRSKSTTSIWNGSPQRELTTNPLSGKLGADHWLLTENVKDFRPILLRALQADTAITGILYTSSRAFPPMAVPMGASGA